MDQISTKFRIFPASFGTPFQPIQNYPLTFLPLPILFWITYRFEHAGATLGTAILSVIAIVQTIHGSSPFGTVEKNQELMVLQMFMGTISVSTILFASAISERKQALNQLRESEYRFRLVVESALNSIVLMNQEGKIVLVNSQTEKSFGYSREELIGQTVELLIPDRFKARHPHYRDVFFADPKTRPMGAGRDLYARRKDSSEFPVEIGLNPVQTEKGPMVLGSIVDITQRKHAEEKLLEEKKNLERVNLELDNFVYIASHDLRTPIRAIVSFADIFEEVYTGKNLLEEEGKMFLNQIKTAARRMSTLIQDLLTLSRISRIKNPYEHVDMNQLLDSVKKRLESDIEQTGTLLSISLPMPTIYCDRIKLTEVFVNLIQNAIKFSAKVAKPRIFVRFSSEENHYHFSVNDNGIGIAAEHQKQIFEMFRRLHRSEEYEGTGTGLYIVKRIIEDHGGQIWVESEPGKGSTFHFAIPKKLNGVEHKQSQPIYTHVLGDPDGRTN